MTQTSLAPHPSRLSVESNTSSTVDVEKSRISIDSTSDDATTIRIPFSQKRTSRKLFCAVLIIANILFIALAVGLAVGLSLRLRHAPGSGSGSPSTASGAGSSPAGVEDLSHGGGGGSNRVY
ncbi:hypothetical protein TWF506_004772 [Arthrobotrys conoides]|uniref:Uncharacterized protein n=1 Tax=Arthrobotrys conoides TaxID=74498 RepID=A0AAN8RP45_9PEZI